MDMRRYFSPLHKVWLGLLVFLSAASVQAQTPVPDLNIVRLQASGLVEVPSDWLSFVLSVTVQDKDSQAVQRQLKEALDQALREARKAESPGQLELRTGAFNLNPVYARDSKINQWQGVAELVVQGRNFEKISTLAGSIHSMAVARTSIGLSRELREETEAKALDLALQQFRAKAQRIAQGFGFGSYTLRELSVSTNAPQEGPAPVMLRMAAASMAEDVPVSVEGGKSLVRVQLSGTVQLK
jgi:predicted secreted protein